MAFAFWNRFPLTGEAETATSSGRGWSRPELASRLLVSPAAWNVDTSPLSPPLVPRLKRTVLRWKKCELGISVSPALKPTQTEVSSPTHAALTPHRVQQTFQRLFEALASPLAPGYPRCAADWRPRFNGNGVFGICVGESRSQRSIWRRPGGVFLLPSGGTERCLRESDLLLLLQGFHRHPSVLLLHSTRFSAPK